MLSGLVMGGCGFAQVPTAQNVVHLRSRGNPGFFCDRSTLLDALAEVVLTGAGMLQEILTALCLVLVIEGILPFLMPARWQRMLGGIAELGVRQIRLAGLASMLIGTLCLYLVR